MLSVIYPLPVFSLLLLLHFLYRFLLFSYPSFFQRYPRCPTFAEVEVEGCDGEGLVRGKVRGGR